jgi:hypothetical protein
MDTHVVVQHSLLISLLSLQYTPTILLCKLPWVYFVCVLMIYLQTSIDGFLQEISKRVTYLSAHRASTSLWDDIFTRYFTADPSEFWDFAYWSRLYFLSNKEVETK